MSSGNIKSNSTTKRMDSNRVRLYAPVQELLQESMI